MSREISTVQASLGGPLDIVVLTHFASPYQVELFNEVARLKRDGFVVYYLHRIHPTRSWNGGKPNHSAHFFRDELDAVERAKLDFQSARLAIFNFYNEPPVPELLRVRQESGLPWCFWGERPGYKNKLLGRLLRRWKLRALHASSAPIWGIGKFAIEQYQEEFGRHRAYHDLPYFSDLSRFGNTTRAAQNESRLRTFLFSGSLVERKGVDLLSRAFVRVAREFPNARLRLMGEGRLRDALRRILDPVSERVEFLGFKDWVDLPAAYRGADVLCVPSRYDGWGLVVPEGLASGLPVIATDRMGAALEFLETGRNGWLIRAQDEHALYTALREAASLPPERLLAMAEAARDSVKDHSLRNGAQRFLAAAREAVGNWRN
jgi:glycosyltransferase involved in cell wall biosynthesis